MQTTENLGLQYVTENEESTTKVRDYRRSTSSNFQIIDTVIAEALQKITDNEDNIKSLDEAIAELQKRGIYLCSNDETSTLEDGTNVPNIKTPDSSVVYLVSSGDSVPNMWLEYIWVNEEWEQWGSATIDLTGYASESYVNTKTSAVLTSANEYTDTKSAATLSSAKSDATTKANNALSSAKTYVNKYIGDVDSIVDDYVENYWSGKRAIFFGTSITWYCMSGREYENTGYPKLVANALGLNFSVSKDVVGMSGMAMADSRNGDGIYSGIESKDVSGADLVCIECSTNDFKLDISLGSTSSSSTDESTFCGALRYAIEEIKDQNPDAIIMLISDTKRNNDGYSSLSTNKAGHKQEDYVNAMASIAKKYGTIFCDWYNDSGITMSNLGTYTIDGLHLNNKGYSKVGKLTANTLQEYAADVVTIPTLCDTISRLETLEAELSDLSSLLDDINGEVVE